MAIKLTLTVKPRRRSLRLAARHQQARHQPYPQRQSAGSQPISPPQPRASSPIIKQEPQASLPIIKREESRPPLNIIPFTPINAVSKRELKPKKDEDDEEEEEVEEKGTWEIPLHSIPQFFPALGPNTGSEWVDPRYVPGNYVLDERGVERRVLGRGEVASLTTMQCWENGDLF